jgi:hypothetical protein
VGVEQGRRYLVYVKLDPVKVAWIIRQKEGDCMGKEAIANSMNLSVRRVQRLYSLYKNKPTRYPS